MATPTAPAPIPASKPAVAKPAPIPAASARPATIAPRTIPPSPPVPARTSTPAPVTTPPAAARPTSWLQGKFFGLPVWLLVLVAVGVAGTFVWRKLPKW